MDIFVPPGQEGGASPGEMVTVELTRWPTRRAAPSAASPRCSATSTRPASTPRSSSASTAFPTRIRAEAVAEAVRLGAAVSRARHPRPHRLPRRRRPSPSTASTRATSTTRSRSRSCRTATTGSACTSPTSRTTCRRAARSIAKAYERGTSVYFPERAVHMFPSELATGLCSLNPHVDRLVQSCLMEVDRRGDGRALRVPRRRDQQRRADDLHRGQRHPDRPRSRS